MNEKLINILDSITWYNGLNEPLWKLKKELYYCDDNEKIFSFDESLKNKYTDEYDNQFEIFWMILVLLYGDYGTSPRSGWLYANNKDKIIKFINRITKTALEEENR